MNNPASQLAKKRWKNKTPEERSAHARKMALAYWSKVTPEKKKEHIEKMHAKNSKFDKKRESVV